MPEPTLVPLPGSERGEQPGATRIGPVPADETIQFSVALRPRKGAPDMEEAARNAAATGKFLSPEELAAATAPDPADVQAVEEYARGMVLTVEGVDPVTRRVQLSGSAVAVKQAFGVSLDRYEYRGVIFRGRTGPVLVPESLAGIIVGVLGTDDRPMASSSDGKVSSGTRATGKIAHILNEVFTTWPRRIGALVAAALIPLVVTLTWDGTTVNQLRADNDTLRDQVNSLTGQVNGLTSQANGLKSENAKLKNSVSSAESSETTLKNSLCNILKSAADSGQLPSPSQAEATCGPVLPLLAVARPRPGDTVTMATEAAGTVDVSQLAGQTIWFGVTTPGVPGLFLEGNWQARTGPATLTPEGTWTSPGLFVGEASDTGKPFDIVVILADGNAANQFWAYLRQGYATGTYPPILHLPKGTHELPPIDVVRK